MATETQSTESYVTHSLSPHLICNDAYAAIEFYKKAFGAKEMMRLPGPDGKLMHGSVSIFGAMVMLAEENTEWKSFGPKTLGGTPVVIHLNVDNVDEVIETAVEAGAKLVMPATDMFWGDRYGQVEDPFGHLWSIATQLKKMTVDEIQQAMGESMPECGKTVDQ